MSLLIKRERETYTVHDRVTACVNRMIVCQLLCILLTISVGHEYKCLFIN